jgi:PAS domain S-box-containing protein
MHLETVKLYLEITALLVSTGVIPLVLTFLKHMKKVSEVLPIIGEFEKALPKINAISEQFRPNGGSSLKDAITRIEASLIESSADLKEMKKMFEGQLDTSLDGIFVTDNKGWCLRANNGLQDIQGDSENGIKGYGWTKNLHPEDRDRVRQAWEDAVNHKGTFNEKYRFLNPKEGVIHVHCISAPLKDDADGRYLGHVRRVPAPKEAVR